MNKSTRTKEHNSGKRLKGVTFNSRVTNGRLLEASYPKTYDPSGIGLAWRGLRDGGKSWEGQGGREGRRRWKEEVKSLEVGLHL